MLNSTFQKTPGIATPRERKEIKFFLPKTMPRENTYAEYLKAFAADAEGRSKARFTFEASPPYSHLPLSDFRRVLSNIRETLPNCQIVLCVRQPLIRAYSHYIHDLHQFGLFGANIFNRAHKLVEAPYETSFLDAMKARRFSLGYAERLEAIFEYFDRPSITIFFLEWDVLRFRDWVANLTDPEIAANMPLKAGAPEQVIRRRKLPNYARIENRLVAFGSRRGDLIEYQNVSEKRIIKIMKSRKRWTLRLDAAEIRQGTREYFGEDLEKCARITGNERFKRYLEDDFPSQIAQLSNPRALEKLHHWPEAAAASSTVPTATARPPG